MTVILVLHLGKSANATAVHYSATNKLLMHSYCATAAKLFLLTRRPHVTSRASFASQHSCSVANC